MKQPHLPEHVLTAMQGDVVALTGAGISKASGIPTFRGQDGLWKKYSAAQLATPSAFQNNPQLVWDWYIYRLNIIMAAQPNPAHYALVQLEKQGLLKTLITQNVDSLHQEAGSQKVLELHGNIRRIWCTHCDQKIWLQTPPSTIPLCPTCNSIMRPDVIWFGEALSPSILSAAIKAAEQADVMLVIGTSALVSPASELPYYTKQKGGLLLEFNPQPTPISPVSYTHLTLPTN